MRDLLERIKEVRKSNGLTQKEFADAIGCSQGNVGDWERGRSSPSVSAIYNIVNTFNVDPAWLLTGKGEASAEEKKNTIEVLFLRHLTEEEKKEVAKFAKYLMWLRREDELEKEGEKERQKNKDRKPADILSVAENGAPYLSDGDQVYLPLLGDAAAGQPIHIEELLEGYVPINKKKAQGNCFLIRAKGDSMIEAGIEDEDLLVVRMQQNLDDGDIALVRLEDEATVKHFYKRIDHIELRPANSKYKSIARTDVSVIGKVVEVIKKEAAEKKMRFFHLNQDFFNNY